MVKSENKKSSAIRTAAFRDALKEKGMTRAEVVVPVGVKQQLLQVSGDTGLNYGETASAILELGLKEYARQASVAETPSSPILDFLKNRKLTTKNGESK